MQKNMDNHGPWMQRERKVIILGASPLWLHLTPFISETIRARSYMFDKWRQEIFYKESNKKPYQNPTSNKK